MGNLAKCLLSSVAELASFSLMDSMVSLRDPKALTRASKMLAVEGGSVFELSFGLAGVVLPRASSIAMLLHPADIGLGAGYQSQGDPVCHGCAGFAAHHMNWTKAWQWLFSNIANPSLQVSSESLR